ncbi:MAG: lcfB 5 [Nocardioidaceae bacterium]|nr:lcfB 5 [Nocardioidaceae bacterium]
MSAAGSNAMPAHRAMNVARLLTQTARRCPDDAALVHGTTRWTWRELDERVNALAEELRARGVRAGQCVLLDGPNSAEFVQAMFATWRIGAVLAPVNSRLHDSDLVQIASVCRPVAMIVHPSSASHVGAVGSALDAALITLWLDADGGDVATSDRVGEYARTTCVVADENVWVGDHAWYFFTSGTSSAPKAAVLTHDQLGYVVTNHLADLMPTTTEDHRSLVVAPLSHGAGVHLLPQVARGAATIVPVSASLDPAEVWSLVEAEHVTNMFTVPTILKRLVEDPAADVRDHSSLAYVIYAGAPIASKDQAHAIDKLGPVLVQYYGLAEVTGNITVLPPRLHGHQAPEGVEFGTCGFARTGMQVSIQDDHGTEVGVLETGEICVAGPGVFAGYLDNHDANAAAFRDGWFRTGDVGMLDESGALFITGRVSDMYISGGSNVHPRDIEEKVLTHPSVAEALVLGMPDASWGEVGVAVCVATPGTTIDPDELRAFLTTKMARYKVPRHVVVWDELPRSAYGKVVRRTVRDVLAAEGWGTNGAGSAPNVPSTTASAR